MHLYIIAWDLEHLITDWVSGTAFVASWIGFGAAANRLESNQPICMAGKGRELLGWLSSASKTQGDAVGLEGKKNLANKNLKPLISQMKHLTSLSVNDCVSEPGNADSESMGAQHRAAGFGSAPYPSTDASPRMGPW